MKGSGPIVTAVEFTLGGAMQHIITENAEAAAKQAITYLKKKNLGRVTFLPLNNLRIARPREAELNALGEDEIIGFAERGQQTAERSKLFQQNK